MKKMILIGWILIIVGLLVAQQVSPFYEVHIDKQVLFKSTAKALFYDSDISIYSSTDGQMDIDADTEVEITATTVDLNGNLDVSGTTTLTGAVSSSDTLTASWIKTATFAGQGTFTTTEQLDTVLVSGIASGDIVVCTPTGTADPQDVLAVTLASDTLFVNRPAAGASGLVYNYVIIKK